MSSPGIAPKEDHMYSAQVPITISGGNVDPIDAYLSPRGVAKFINNDGKDYVIQFLVRGEDPSNPKAIHPDVDLFLPAYDSRTMVAGRGLDKGECKYRVLPVLASSIGVRGRIREMEEIASVSEELASSGEKILQSAEVEYNVTSNAARGGGGGTIHIGS